MSRAKLLAQRRALLITECALQRITLAGQTHSMECVSWLKTGSNLVDRLKHLPGWASALFVGVMIFAPGRAVSLAKNGVLLLQLWRSFSSKPGTHPNP